MMMVACNEGNALRQHMWLLYYKLIAKLSIIRSIKDEKRSKYFAKKLKYHKTTHLCKSPQIIPLKYIS